MNPITLKCGTQYPLESIEVAELSYVPCGIVEGEEQPLLKFSQYWGKRRQVKRTTYGRKWNAWTTSQMTGVQIMTGQPSYRLVNPKGYIYLVVLDVEYRLMVRYPEIYQGLLVSYGNHLDGDPCVIGSKSGGRHLYGYSSYCGPKLSYSDKVEDGDLKTMLFEVFSDKGLVRITDDYEMLKGSVVNIPILSQEGLREMCKAVETVGETQTSRTSSEVVERSRTEGIDVEIQWDENGWSQLLPTQYCGHGVSHASNRNEVRLIRRPDGSIIGICHNCDSHKYWIEKEADTARKPPPPPPELLEPGDPKLQKILAAAPQIEVRERPSYPYWSPEARVVVKSMGLDPDAGYIATGKNGHLAPAWVRNYSYIHNTTGKFALNGQPEEIMKHRVWFTTFDSHQSHRVARWVDIYQLTHGTYNPVTHEDLQQGSYLEIELERKLENPIDLYRSQYVWDDPDFQANLPLHQPDTLTLLSCAMATGKTFSYMRDGRQRLESNPNLRLIWIFPTISLAEQMHTFANAQPQLDEDGQRKPGNIGFGRGAFGLYVTGNSMSSERKIGWAGAICCLPSLPRVMHDLYEDRGEGAKTLIVIDEVDFVYEQFLLDVESAPYTKDIFRNSVAEEGLVIAGQTEFPIAAEHLRNELDAERFRTFYKTARPAKGVVSLCEVPNVEGKTLMGLTHLAENITQHLAAGRNVYVFCKERREAYVLAEIPAIARYHPILYTGHVKGDSRSRYLFQTGRMPAGERVFITTAAAAVGLSFQDPRGVTEITTGLHNGFINAKESVQESTRNRSLTDVYIRHARFNLPLPTTPTESEEISLLHESQKAAEGYGKLSEHGVRRIGAIEGLKSLTTHQYPTFVKHHLQHTAGMEVIDVGIMPPDDANLAAIRELRSQQIKDDRSLSEVRAVEILQSIKTAKQSGDPKDSQLMSQHSIAITTRHSTDRIEIRSHMLATKTLIALGWRGKLPVEPTQGDFESISKFDERVSEWRQTMLNIFKKLLIISDDAQNLIDQHINIDTFQRLRRGYIAAHHCQINEDLMHEDAGQLETTAVSDDRFRGRLLLKLLEALKGRSFSESELDTTLLSVLESMDGTMPFIEKIQEGHMGLAASRQARFLLYGDSHRRIQWARHVIKNWYPARIEKQGDTYNLLPHQHATTICNAIANYLAFRQVNVNTAHVENVAVIANPPLPDPNAEKKARARQMRQDGTAVKDIAEALDVNKGTIYRWCRGVKPPDLKAEAIKRWNNGNGESYRTIGKKFKKSPNTIRNWCHQHG